MKRIFLYQYSSSEIKEMLTRNIPGIIIPVGSIEQHGAHLPLGTDTLVAEKLAEAVAPKTGSLVAPSISCGWSPHHMVLPGTITIRPEILIEYIYDMLESFSEHGFKKVLIINGHRIVNIPWLQIAAERAKRQLKMKILLADPAYLSKEFTGEEGMGNVGHAEAIETSHLLYVYPELVQMDKVVDFPHDKKEYLEVDPKARQDLLCYIPSSREEMKESAEKGAGVGGEPSKASKEQGKRYHNWIVNKLAQIVNEEFQK